MGSYLLAVLVGPDATIDTVDTHLAAPMRRLLRAHRVDSYRLGGAVTGASTRLRPRGRPAQLAYLLALQRHHPGPRAALHRVRGRATQRP
jgi:hypothetical protein